MGPRTISSIATRSERFAAGGVEYPIRPNECSKQGDPTGYAGPPYFVVASRRNPVRPTRVGDDPCPRLFEWLTHLGKRDQSAFHLYRIGRVTGPNASLQLIEAHGLTLHELHPLVPLPLSEGSEKSGVRIDCSPNAGATGNRGVRKTSLAEG